jgi:hypothetical protein
VIRPGAADFTEHPVALLRLQARVESLLASRPIDRMRGGPGPEVAGGGVYWRRTVVGEEMPLSNHFVSLRFRLRSLACFNLHRGLSRCEQDNGDLLSPYRCPPHRRKQS